MTSKDAVSTYRISEDSEDLAGYIRKNEFCFFVWSQGAGCNFTRL